MDDSSKKIKVLFVVTKSNFGGAQKYVYDLATSLPKDQFEVAVILGGNGVLVDKLTNANIRTIPLLDLTRDIHVFQDVMSFFTLLNIFRKEKPDVIHLNSAKASGLGALAGRIALVPRIIFTAHGWAFNENRTWLARMIIKIISWKTILLSHKTIAVSESIARSMRWIGATQKMVVIKNGVDPMLYLSKEIARKEIEAMTKIKFPSDAFIVGTIAELHPSKGLENAVRAFALFFGKNPDSYYVIFGDGQEKVFLNNLIVSLGLQDHIFLLGFVNKAPQYLKALDCFVLPSNTEALGIVLLEAGLAGVPSVATNVGGIPEIIENAKTGILVPSHNIESIERALEELASSPSLRTTLGHALYEKVLREFSMDIMLTKTIALYRN